MVDLPQGLRNAARSGDLNVLVGAGISCGAGLPKWRDLLDIISCELDERQRIGVRRIIDEGRYLDAAELLADHLPPSVLHNALTNALENPLSEPTVVHDAVRDLDVKVIFTTNYDDLIERSFQQADMGTKVYVGTENSSVGMARGAPQICKLHGDLQRPETIVFARSDYFRVMSQVATGAATAWGKFSASPCLAIGYSLYDPDLQLLLHWINTTLGGYGQPMYVATSESREEEIRLLRRHNNVVPVQYEVDDNHEVPLREILSALTNEQATDRFAKSVPPAEIALLKRSVAHSSLFIHQVCDTVSAARASLSAIDWDDPTQSDTLELKNLERNLKEVSRCLSAAVDLLVATTQRVRQASWSDCLQALETELSRLTEVVQIESVIEPIAGSRQLPVGPALFSILIQILIDNSVEAIRESEQDSEVSLSITTRGSEGHEFLEIVVRDYGPGIAESAQSRLFFPGWSTKGSDRGHGLFLLRTIVDECGGGVQIVSAADKGTISQVSLPFVGSTASAKSNRPSKSTKVQRFPTRLSLLLLDDNADFASSFSEMLEIMNCNVRAFKSYDEFERHLRRIRRPPDLIILDLLIPGSSGYLAATMARNKFSNVPIIFCSGYFHEGGGQLFPNSKFVKKKSISSEKLFGAITELLGPWP